MYESASGSLDKRGGHGHYMVYCVLVPWISEAKRACIASARDDFDGMSTNA